MARSTTRLTTRGKIAVGTAGLVLAGGGYAAEQGIAHALKDQAQEAAQQRAEIDYFSQPNLAHNLENNANRTNNKFSRFGSIGLYQTEKGDTYWNIASELGAENHDQAVDEMIGQHGNILHPGDVIALPMNRLNSEDVVLDPNHTVAVDNSTAQTETGGQFNQQLVTYIVPKNNE